MGEGQKKKKARNEGVRKEAVVICRAHLFRHLTHRCRKLKVNQILGWDLGFIKPPSAVQA
jgi:hypothetical protein